MRFTKLRLSGEELKYSRNLALLALVLNFIVEILNRNSFVATFLVIIKQPHIFLYNSLILFATLSITLLVKRRIATCSLISVIWLAFGIANNILLHFRITPFTAVDLTMISEALPIMDKYLSFYQMIAIAVLILLALFLLILAFIKLPKHKSSLNYISNIIATTLIIVSTIALSTLGMRLNILARNFGNIADAFKDYGFAYCFANSLVNTGIHKPSNYSEETILEIVEATEDFSENLTEVVPQPNQALEAEPVVEKKTPNIIFLQLESFFDPTRVEGLTFSSDPLPNYHALMDSYTSGFLNVPSVGAGTANTEFEIITGMNLDYFGPGEYPYKTILKETTCESMAYNLKELEYNTHAIHNNTATFYGRNKVFSNLGFDDFISEEYMKNITYNPIGWAKDQVLIEQIINALDSTEGQDYIYTISVQGHGKYPKDAESFYSGIVSEGIDGDFKEETDEITTIPTPTEKPTKKPSKKEKENSKKKPSKTSTKKNESLPNETVSPSALSYEPTIQVYGMEESRTFAFEYYVNQIHEMDQFVGNLVETLENYDEDIVLVMYGDHLPSLGIEADDLVNKNMYQTEYVIWSSKGVIDGKHDRELEAYQLSAYTLSLLNQNPGLLTKLHQQEFIRNEQFQDTFASESIDKDSEATPSPTEVPILTLPNEDNETITYHDELELLQYDMLYGKQECYDRVNPYLPTNLQYGVLPIVISNVEWNKNLVTVSGKNFTTFSNVLIDDEVIPTTFIDSNTLTFEADDFNSDTKLVVAQINKEGTEISRTVEFITK